MRVPADPPPRTRSRRRNLIFLGVIVGLLVLLFVVQGLAGFYANFLWFHWNGAGVVWRQVIVTKIVLAAVFVFVAWAVLWASLYVVDTVAPRAAFLGPDNELVRRYQSAVGPHALALRTVVSFIVALIVGSGASGQWQHWILFENSTPYGLLDPQFHRDASFYVFRLPFLSFVVDWIFTTLIVVFVVTAIAYFLNGAIRLSRSGRVEARAVAHLSLILALLALERAWAFYYVDRYDLDLSSNGVVQGAGYTDVHVRVAALTLLAIVSLIVFVLFSVNVYQRSVILPGIALGLWALLALVIGVIFPEIVQVLRVTPSQSTLELPYIADNIQATRFALGISDVSSHAFPANQDLTPAVLDQYQATLANVNLWDPSVTQKTFQNLQQIRSYYAITPIAVDRYLIDGKLTPVVIAARSLNTGGLPRQSWVNTHLAFTHGYGVVAAAGNAAGAANLPDFLAGGIPQDVSTSALSLRQSAVYYAPGNPTYVIADSGQPETLYQNAAGNSVLAHCHGCGGIPIDGLFSRLSFAIRLRDLNLLISNLVNSKSRLIYISDIEARVQKALPFLKVDAHPYPVIVHGDLDWVVDAYTTSSSYPYSQSGMNSSLPSNTGLTGTFNYVRDAVKAVVNGYTGEMTFYVIAPQDPMIRAYEHAFPGLFSPESKMDPVLLAHLRYPQDLLMLQAQAFGRYHITSPSPFYSLSDAWNLSQTSNSTTGSPSSPLLLGANGFTAPFTPVYELLQLPGQSELSFDALEPLVPYSANDSLKTLRAIMVADSSVGSYGKLDAYVTPGESVHGPALANADINADPVISKAITLLDSKGSSVSLGSVQVLPIADSLIYVRPLYVSSAQTPFPKLEDVVVVYGKQIAMESTLQEALAEVFGTAPASSGPPPSTGSITAQEKADIAEALADYNAAQVALSRGDLGAYQSDVQSAGRLLKAANTLISQGKSDQPVRKTTSHRTTRAGASA